MYNCLKISIFYWTSALTIILLFHLSFIGRIPFIATTLSSYIDYLQNDAIDDLTGHISFDEKIEDSNVLMYCLDDYNVYQCTRSLDEYSFLKKMMIRSNLLSISARELSIDNSISQTNRWNLKEQDQILQQKQRIIENQMYENKLKTQYLEDYDRNMDRIIRHYKNYFYAKEQDRLRLYHLSITFARCMTSFIGATSFLIYLIVSWRTLKISSK